MSNHEHTHPIKKNLAGPLLPDSNSKINQIRSCNQSNEVDYK